MDFFHFEVGMVGGPAFTADGSQLLWISPGKSTDGKVAVVDVLTGHSVRELGRNTSSMVTAIQLSPDRRRIGICGYAYGRASDGLTSAIGGVVHVWDVPTGDLLLKHKWREGAYCAMAFSPDGNQFAVGGGMANGSNQSGQIVLFEVSSGKSIATLDGHREHVRCLVVTPDGKQLLSSGSLDCDLKTWDLSAVIPALSTSVNLASNPTTIASFAVSPDGTLVFAALANFNRGQKAGELRVLDATSLETLGILLAGHSLPVCNVAISPDGRMLVASDSHGAMFAWDIRNVAGDSAE
jgi:WD40 repeat protein